MINLVWKDLLIIKRYLWVAPLYGFVALFVFGSMKGFAINAATIGASYMLMIQACTKDDKNKSEIVLNCLPLRRRDIVLAKYLSVFFYAVLAIISFLLAQVVVAVTGISIATTIISVEGISLALVNLIILISIYYPIYFKLGFSRSNWVGMFLFFVCFFLPMSASELVNGLEEVGHPILGSIVATMQEIMGRLQTPGDWQIVSYLLALALSLMGASVLLSLRVYSRREF